MRHELPQLVSHLELLFEDEDDELERGSGPEGHPVQDIFSAPALFLQRVADDAILVESGVEVERHVGPRLHAAATREIYLEPARPRGGRHQDRRLLCGPFMVF